MINYWKQFAAWATRLTRDPFIWPRVEFALTNFLVTFALLAVGYTLFLNSRIHNIVSQIPNPTLVKQLTLALQNDALWGFLLLALGLGIAGYLLSNITVRQLRPMVRSQKRFIADASHELRTPLSIIKADSELALLDIKELTPKEMETTLRSNLQEVNRMSKIIDNLLKLSFYDVKVDHIAVQDVNFTSIIDEIVNQAQSLANQKGVHLSTGQTDEIIFSGNGTSLEQMVLNLIRNAILHTPTGGSVVVSLEQKGESALFTVKDTGRGISSEDLPHVFSPFYKAENAEQVPGSGLGLTIVRRIVEMHHGSISLTSELHKGTTVSVLFPLVKSEKLRIRH